MSIKDNVPWLNPAQQQTFHAWRVMLLSTVGGYPAMEDLYWRVGGPDGNETTAAWIDTETNQLYMLRMGWAGLNSEVHATFMIEHDARDYQCPCDECEHSRRQDTLLDFQEGQAMRS